MKRDVRNIWGAALNYRDTAKEVGCAVSTDPIFFLKAGSTLTEENQPIVLPQFSREIFHEIEVALQFNKKLEIKWAGLALDLTAGDAQGPAIEKSRPWTLIKSFKNACPVGSFFPIKDLTSLSNVAFGLTINGEVRQQGNTNQMVSSCSRLVSYLLEHFPVCPYDIVLTGSVGGVGPLKKGDRLTGYLGNYYKAHWTVAR